MSRGLNMSWIYCESLNGNQDTEICPCYYVYTLWLKYLMNYAMIYLWVKTFYEAFLKRICFLIAKEPMCLYGMGEWGIWQRMWQSLVNGNYVLVRQSHFYYCVLGMSPRTSHNGFISLPPAGNISMDIKLLMGSEHSSIITDKTKCFFNLKDITSGFQSKMCS